MLTYQPLFWRKAGELLLRTPLNISEFSESSSQYRFLNFYVELVYQLHIHKHYAILLSHLCFHNKLERHKTRIARSRHNYDMRGGIISVDYGGSQGEMYCAA